MKNIGIILITAGVMMLALMGFTHTVKHHEAGARDSGTTSGSILLWSPVLGTCLFVVGILVVVLAKK